MTPPSTPKLDELRREVVEYRCLTEQLKEIKSVRGNYSEHTDSVKIEFYDQLLVLATAQDAELAKMRAELAEVRKESDIAFKMARHIRNTDKIPALEWGIQGCDLLVELQDINPERYSLEVKSLPPPPEQQT